ncbi:hypothetical protein [Nonomuraea deserti]|uniref:hypothetical protein n=1 Tax=Nonomuraea deserti TaxID=1848322 RepID=UPI0015F2E3DF|nr:hypothetical protein [Nonomuraea deserti]
MARIDVHPAGPDAGGLVADGVAELLDAGRFPADDLPAARLALLAERHVADVGGDARLLQVAFQPVGVPELVDLDADRAVGVLAHGVRGRLGAGQQGDRDEHLGHQVGDRVRVVDAAGEKAGDRIDMSPVEGLESHRICGDLRLFATHRPCSLRRLTPLLGEKWPKGYKAGPSGRVLRGSGGGLSSKS